MSWKRHSRHCSNEVALQSRRATEPEVLTMLFEPLGESPRAPAGLNDLIICREAFVCFPALATSRDADVSRDLAIALPVGLLVGYDGVIHRWLDVASGIDGSRSNCVIAGCGAAKTLEHWMRCSRHLGTSRDRLSLSRNVIAAKQESLLGVHA